MEQENNNPNQYIRYEIPQPEESPNRERLTGNFDKLNVYNWFYKKPSRALFKDIVEVKFKNTRKGYYHNINGLNLNIGEYVAVEGNPGHDIGVVSLLGEVVFEQLKRNRIPIGGEFKKIFRKAKPADLEKWREATALEYSTMIESRKIARSLGLDMKIGDVEYQGDKSKAIFYYIADERVDFRQLIKVLADRFKIRVEMKQIGARQEAGRIGGIGTCGRELCCSTWINNFVSVATNSARYQEMSLNPQKLAGQCSKLKCCLNYELDAYLDARTNLPPTDVALLTKEGKAIHQKTDVFKQILWYSLENSDKNLLIPLTPQRVAEIIELNKKGIEPEKLQGKESVKPAYMHVFSDRPIDSETTTSIEKAEPETKPENRNFQKKQHQKHKKFYKKPNNTNSGNGNQKQGPKENNQ
ncbi:MAG TPA: regulatory iron-sulfur-containing complex subunit RicT [Salinivirgaceae bacterium]|nr:regulatory iron-sulfur-containing complex subunit RicT [Salinivirgaceae bacterium]